ncbi:hypothetical protein QQS21_000891 [Conoideocrella luteorostrata]|uniref:DUF829-domain-containing protein n=1 Tax=Conoideocrella luteorostrata TaxID=1105319 RepID=A0AAJ0D0J3_9HYPO|nr:hypothetical protein QQS21_000891 [Conoideocrella luteorostrata]
MSSATSKVELDVALPIGQDIHLYEPPTPASRDLSSPALIILCTWLGGATPRRVSKYVAGYHERYPSSALLVVTTRIADITVLPLSALHARLQPARDAIRRIAVTQVGGQDPSMLLHIFSHGGCNTALQLMHSLQYEKDLDPSFNLPSHLYGVIFDCCPGDGSFGRAYNAAAASLPNAYLAKTIGKVLLVPFVSTITLLQYLGAMSSITDLRRELNSPDIFGTTARRMYLYSSEDQVVQWQDVESHLEAAKSVSEHAVTGIRFADSAHCAIIREQSETYWKAIHDFWQSRNSKSRSRL